MINFGNGSDQDESDNCFKIPNHSECAQRIISESALTKAGARPDYHAFAELSRHLTECFCREFLTETWNGLNLMAIDGSALALPGTEEIGKHFGERNSGKETSCPAARILQMHDVLNKVTADAVIKPKKEGERELAAWHFPQLPPTDPILPDRGYPAYWLFNLILSPISDFTEFRLPICY